MIGMEGILTEATPREHIRKIRGRVSYKDFKAIVSIVKSGDQMAIMKAIYNLMDKRSAYGSAVNSCAAEESLELVLREEGLWHD